MVRVTQLKMKEMRYPEKMESSEKHNAVLLRRGPFFLSLQVLYYFLLVPSAAVDPSSPVTKRSTRRIAVPLRDIA